eukprot:8627824-Ditylum_brightwellii.AAC.1
MAKILEQLPLCPEMHILPTDEEIHKYISQLHNLAAGSSGFRAENLKVLATEEETFAITQAMVYKLWRNEQQPTKLDIGHMGICPKKGDLSNPGNYRGITMLEVGQK